MFFVPFFVPIFPFYPFYPYPGAIGPFPTDDNLRRKRFWWWYLNRPMMSANTSGTGSGTDPGTTASVEPAIAAYDGPVDDVPVALARTSRKK